MLRKFLRTCHVVFLGLVHRGCVLVCGGQQGLVSHLPEGLPSNAYHSHNRSMINAHRQNHSWSKILVQLVGLSSTLVLWLLLLLLPGWVTNCALGIVGGGRKEARPPPPLLAAGGGDGGGCAVDGPAAAAAGGLDWPAPMLACWLLL